MLLSMSPEEFAEWKKLQNESGTTNTDAQSPSQTGGGETSTGDLFQDEEGNVWKQLPNGEYEFVR
jgi:hypothetical protein